MKVSKEGKLRRYIKAPMRFLIRARDLYVESMMQYFTTNLSYCNSAMGYPVTGVPLTTLPRSFSVGSTRPTTYNSDEFKELARSASVRSYGNRIDSPASAKKSPKTVPRSHSITIGRIKEDKVCLLGNDIKSNPVMFSRSKSQAHHKRTRILF